MVERYETIRKENNKRLERSANRESIEEFMKMLEISNSILIEFEEELSNVAIEVVKVNSDKEITLFLKMC